MATYTVGTGKTYTTLGAFVTAFNSGSLTGAVVAEVYGTTTEGSTIIVTPPAGITSLTIRAASGQENNGVIGAGARCEFSGAGSEMEVKAGGLSSLSEFVIEDLEFRSNTNTALILGGEDTDGPLIVRRCIFISSATSGISSVVHFEFTTAAFASLTFANNIVFNPNGDGKVATDGLFLLDNPGGSSGTETWRVYNNTFYGFSNSGLIADASASFGSTLNVQNNISMGNGPADFILGGVTSSTNNLSSDGTGSTGLTYKFWEDQFIDPGPSIASADLRIKSGADAENAGANLGTTDDIHLDIARYDRTSGTWDIGASEFVSGPTPITKSLTDGLKAKEDFSKNTDNIYDDINYTGSINDSLAFSATIEAIKNDTEAWTATIEEQIAYSGTIEEI